jgi:hypothetical protein
MTEDTEPRVEDKYGKDITIGDRVYFVFGGEHHSMTVDEIDDAQPPDSPYPHILSGQVTVRVHAASTTREYRSAKEEKEQRSGHPQTAHIDKSNQDADTVEGDHKPTPKKGSKS